MSRRDRHRKARERAASLLAAPAAPVVARPTTPPPVTLIDIREAKSVEDVAAIHEFMLGNAVPEMAEASVDGLRYMEHLYRGCNDGTGLMAIEDGHLIGFLGLMPQQFSYSQERFFLDFGFWVLPQHRDGVAFKALLAEAKAIADATQMIVKIVVNNPSRRRGARSHMARTADVIEYRPSGAVLSFYPKRTN